MKTQDKATGSSLEKSHEEISDRHVHRPQDERKAVQERTFTRWMNMFLQRRDPPLEVHNLFRDIQDGRVLMALLEELSGCQLLYRFRSASHRIFRLNNISKALAFLDDRHVKLHDIDASGIADGIPSVVLNLVWTIILHFQIKELTRGLRRHLSLSLSSLPVSSYPSSSDLSLQPTDIGSFACNTLPSKGRKAARESRRHGKATKTLLQWVQRCTSKFGVQVRDFSKSWRSGMALLVMIKSINPDLVDLRESLSREPRENIQQAFTIAHRSLDITPLLEPEDVACPSPDEQSIITYVSMFLGHCSDMDGDQTADIEVPEIPNFGSLESVGFGRTLADDAEAQALFGGLRRSSEQLLWKRWSRRSSGSTRATSLGANEAPTSDLSSSDGNVRSSVRGRSITEQPAGGAATSPFNRKTGRCRGILKPPSPLDTGVVSPEIRSWMEKGSEQAGGKTRVDESHFSWSSEEGIYSVSVLDSDEEDAYSYILDLNRDVFPPYNSLKSSAKVPRVEEETVEEVNEESKHPAASEMVNGPGCRLQRGRQKADFDLEVRAGQLVAEGKFELDKKPNSFRAMTNNKSEFTSEAEDECSREEAGAIRGQINGCGDYGGEEREKETDDARLVTQGLDEAETLVGKVESSKEAEEDTDRGLSGKCVQASEERGAHGEEEGDAERPEQGQEEEASAARGHTAEENDFSRTTAPKMQRMAENGTDENGADADAETTDWADFTAVEEKDRGRAVKKRKLTEEGSTAIGPPGGPLHKHESGGGAHSRTRACRTKPHSFSSGGGFVLQPAAASCDITPLELEMILVLWILLYCCFLIQPQMNL